MSFFRAKNRAINKTVYSDQRVFGFLKSPIRTGNLYVENNENVNKDLTVGGNLTIAKDLNVGGNLTVGKDLFVKGDQTINGNLDVSGNQTIDGDLHVKGDQTIDETLLVKGNQTNNADLLVKGDQTIDGDLDVKGDVSANNVYATGNFYLDNHLLIPPGTIIQYAAATAPVGWLVCNGATVSKTTYADLFNVITTKYGDSGQNFRLPDMQGRVAVGSGQQGAGLYHALASFGGDETHTLSVGEMPSHTHSSNAIGGTIGLMTSTGAHTADDGLDPTGGEADLYTNPLPALTINLNGGGQAHNNMQPYLVLNYLIKY